MHSSHSSIVAAASSSIDLPMVETAAHLVDHVLPPLPVRQWVLSVPKRLRPFLHHNPTIAGAVLRIFLRAIRTTWP